MCRVVLSLITVMILALGVDAQTSPDSAELTRLLKEFLAGASRNDAAIHNRFWAEDLIYTGSSGRRIGKADILRDLAKTPDPRNADSTTTYSAEDIRIQQYGDTAIVAFRLIGITAREGKTQVSQYLNTGTFLKRNGAWQAVSWQATRMPRPDEEGKKDASAAAQALYRAILAGDIKRLESITDESFLWTHPDGESNTRQQLVDQLRSAQLRYAKLETANVAVLVYGDTAVVRGVLSQQRSSSSASRSAAGPSTSLFTLTLANRGGDWKAVALHCSRP